MARRTRLHPWLLLGAAATLAVSACGTSTVDATGDAPVPTEPPTTICSAPGVSPGTALHQPPEPDVVVVGDSQTVGEWCAGPEPERALAQYRSFGLIAEVDGIVGARAEKALKELTTRYKRRADLPPSIVFTAGGNDAAAGRSTAQFTSVLRRLVAWAPRDRQIYLTTLSYNPAGPDEAFRSRRYAYNDAMRAFAKRFRNVHIIDFDLVVRRDVLEFRDEVHLKAASYNVRAWHVAHAVATCGTLKVCPEPS